MRSYGQRRSQAQEKRTAKELGGFVQPGSGSMDFAKGDVRDIGKIRVECKTTGKDRYALKLADLHKIRLEALKGGLESWAFQIQFQRSAGMTTRIAVIDSEWFRELGGLDGGHGPLLTGKMSTTILRGDGASPWRMSWKTGQELKITDHFTVCGWETFLDLYSKAKT